MAHNIHGMEDHEYLLDLANRLMRIPPAYGVDGADIDSLGWIAKAAKADFNSTPSPQADVAPFSEGPITDEEQHLIGKASQALYHRCEQSRGKPEEKQISAEHDAMMRLRRRHQEVEAALAATQRSTELSAIAVENGVRWPGDPAPQPNGRGRPDGHCSNDAAWDQFSKDYSGRTRADLCKGEMTDFALANAQFMCDRNSLDLIVHQTAAKERIRWLSIQLARALAATEDSADAKERTDLRPTNCRFRLQDEGKAFPKSSCQGCGKSITSGLGRECTVGHPPASANEGTTP